MPPLAYIVNIIPSDELRLNKIDFTMQLERLEEEYANAFTRWSNLIRKNAEQILIDREEQIYKNIECQTKKIYNKMIKTRDELERRDRLQFR